MSSTNGLDDLQGTLREMHRNRPERRLAGVCAALAARMDAPLPLVRAGFLIGALIPGASALVIALYLALWFVTPPALGEPSGLDQVISALRDLLGFDAPTTTHAPAVRPDDFPSGPSV
jgi:phage shock protein PspC (stress-responsive transcriptional regulator)